MLAKARALGLAAGVTVTVVAWGVLVFLAIDHGRAPRNSMRDWAILGGATVGAIVMMFLAIMCVAKLRDLLRGEPEEYDEPRPARSTRAASVAPVALAEDEEEDDWTALGKGIIPAQRTASRSRRENVASPPPHAPLVPLDSTTTTEPLRPGWPSRPPLTAGTPVGAGLPDLVPANGRGRVDDDPAFVSYAGQGEATDPADATPAFEPRWANETGEHYYRDLGQRPPSRHSAPTLASTDGEAPTEDPPPSTTYATPGKRALR